MHKFLLITIVDLIPTVAIKLIKNFANQCYAQLGRLARDSGGGDPLTFVRVVRAFGVPFS